MEMPIYKNNMHQIRANEADTNFWNNPKITLWKNEKVTTAQSVVIECGEWAGICVDTGDGIYTEFKIGLHDSGATIRKYI